MNWKICANVVKCMRTPTTSVRSIPWLQKVMSLTNDVLVYNNKRTPHVFVLYKNSVHSFDVERAIAEALSIGLLELHPATGGYGQLVVNEVTRERFAYELIVDRQWYVASDYVCNLLGGDTITDIDKLSLASWFLARGFSYDRTLGELLIRKGNGVTRVGVAQWENYVYRVHSWLTASTDECDMK